MDSVDFILWMRAEELGDRGQSWQGIADAILDGVFTPGEIDELLERCAEMAGYRHSGRHSWLKNIRSIRKRLSKGRRLAPWQCWLLRDCGRAADIMRRAGGAA